MMFQKGQSDKLELKEFLDEKYKCFDTRSFIPDDPVSIPHRFTDRNDIEISGFLAAMLAWGQRKTIIKKTTLLIELMDSEPYEFITGSTLKDWERFERFAHRTFNGVDCVYFMGVLQYIYSKYGGIGEFYEEAFIKHKDLEIVHQKFHQLFFSLDHPSRTKKHLANIATGSSGKRLNMYTRWMVRTGSVVDFGIWKKIPASALFLPLDVHTGNVGRALGLLTRKQNDWKAVLEITENLRELDPVDPIKYDIALFALGAVEGFC